MDLSNYKDFGVDLFCYHVTEDGLEGYYQTPYPLDHKSKVSFGYGKLAEEREEERYRIRIEEYGISSQKYQVNLKKM